MISDWNQGGMQLHLGGATYNRNLWSGSGESGRGDLLDPRHGSDASRVESTRPAVVQPPPLQPSLPSGAGAGPHILYPRGTSGRCTQESKSPRLHVSLL
jgi:hypothetical protein